MCASLHSRLQVHWICMKRQRDRTRICVHHAKVSVSCSPSGRRLIVGSSAIQRSRDVKRSRSWSPELVPKLATRMSSLRHIVSRHRMDCGCAELSSRVCRRIVVSRAVANFQPAGHTPLRTAQVEVLRGTSSDPYTAPSAVDDLDSSPKARQQCAHSRPILAPLS